MPAQPFIQALVIERFRGVKELKLEAVRRITLVGGLNGAGKSTVLDAVFQFMDSGNPMQTLRSAQFRNTPVNLQTMHRINDGGHGDGPGVHQFRTRNGDFKVTWIWEAQSMGSMDAQSITISKENDSSTAGSLFGYTHIIERDRRNVQVRRYTGESFDGMMMKQDMGENIQFPLACYLSRTTILSPVDLASRYSTVIQQGDKRKFLNAISSLSRKVDDAEILHIANQPVIHVTIDDITIPLSFAGDGILTIAAIVLAIMSSKGGVVLIDEFDASVHYSKLVDVWRLFHSLAKEYDTQIIAATHSRESIIALFHAVPEHNKQDCIYYRLDGVNGQNVATSYDWDEMREADAENWEFR